MAHWEQDEQDEATHVYQPGFNMHSQRAGAPADFDVTERWFISRDGRAKEVLTAREIIEATQAGLLSEQALVWRDGLTDWTPLGQVPELMRAVRAFVGHAGVLPPPPSVPAFASRPVVHRTLPPMPSLPPIAGLPPIPSLPPPPGSYRSGMQAGHTTQAMVVGHNAQDPEAKWLAVPWGRAVELPGFGLTSLRAVVLLGAVLLGGIGLGALTLDGARAPKPLVISGDVGTSKEMMATLHARAAAVAAPSPANGAVGIEPGSLPRAGGAGARPASAPVTPSPPVQEAAPIQPAALVRQAEPAQEAAPVRQAEPVRQTQRASAPAPAPIQARSEPAARFRPTPEPAPARPEPEPEPEKPRDALTEAMHQRVKPAKGAEPSEDEAAPAKASAGGDDFDLGATKAALAAAAGRASKCQPKGGPTGAGSVRVTIGPSGSVTSVAMQTAKFQDTSTGNCVQMVFRQAKVPPFSGSEKSVNKKFTIPD